MSNVYLKLETFAGGSINEAIADALGVAQRAGCWVKINLNGIDTLISPDDSLSSLERNYAKARERGATFVSANVVPLGNTA